MNKNENKSPEARDGVVHNAQSETNKVHKTLTIIGIVLCVILIPILIINCTLIIKSFVKKDEVPNIGGITPLIVLTDSMEPVIKKGDIIVAKKTATEDIKEGMVISFFDPAGNGSSVVTHRVMYVIDDGDGTVSFKTAGDSNVAKSGGNAENELGYDKTPVPAEKVVGVYSDVRIPGAGHVALFMQRTEGLIVCVLIPLVLLVGYDILRRRKHDKAKDNDVAALMAELEALKKMQNAECGTQNEVPSEMPGEAPDETQNNDSEVKNEEQSD